MLDQWFKRDIQNRTERHSIVVFLDEYGATEAPLLDSHFRGNDKQIRDGLIISWGLIPRPLGGKYLISILIPCCLRRGSLIIYFCSYLILLFILF